MRKFAIAFLGNRKPSLLSPAFFKRPSLFLSTLAPKKGRCEGISKAALKAREPRKLKADGSLQVQISTAIADGKANAKAKSRPKATGKSEANVEQQLGHIVAGAKASELSYIGVFKTGTAAQNEAVENTEELASHAKAVVDEEKAEKAAVHPNALESIMNARHELAECVARLDLHSFKRGHWWEETAYKLLNYGIPCAHVMKMLSKCKRSCSARNTDCILKHFTMLGMSHEEMGHAISHWPRVLGVSNSMFQRKVEFFESVGIDRCSLRKIMHLRVEVIASSLSTLREHCGFWKGYFQDVRVNALRTLILRNPSVLSLNLQRTVKPRVAYLEEQGYSKKNLLMCTSLVTSSPEAITAKSKLLEQFGISNASNRIWAVVSLQGVSKAKLHGRLNNLLVLGLSFDQVQKILNKFPALLSRTEDHINLKFSYAVNVMNLSLDTLVACTAFWSSNYEKRIKYRYEILQELITLGAYKKHISVGYMLTMKDTDFFRRFVKRLPAYTKQSNI